MAERHEMAPTSRADVFEWPERPARDDSGHVIFSAGHAGAAHVMAHRMLDDGRFDAGRRWLGDWLGRHRGSGSDWVHLQFHMAVFELAVGDSDAAYTRYLQEILRPAAMTEHALTDAPALAWRLTVAARKHAELHWDVLRRTALRRMARPSDPFVTLHNLLALAGARDAASIGQWLETRRRGLRSPGTEGVLESVAEALIACADGRYHRAADGLRAALPALENLGGSRAQNELFPELERSWRQAADAPLAHAYADAA
jgi:hypothetical protein